MDRVACRCGAFAVVVVVLAGWLASTPGALASGWSSQYVPDPNPPGATNPFSDLVAVSCVSSTVCTAVGYYTGGTLAERWNGKRWSIQPTPRLQGELTGVSCSSQTDCIAVGTDHTNDPDQATLVERWDGTKWSIQQTPIPATDSSSLRAVSCASPTACTAVGSTSNFDHPERPLVARWNGTRWSIQRTPVPKSGGGLVGVSCASTRSCMAVGSAQLCQPTRDCLPSSDGALAERWNGKRWSIQSATSPTALPALTGVSCSSPTACWAVGYSNSIAGPPRLSLVAERWNGVTWSVDPINTPLAVGETFPFFTGVSCASATACTATVAHYECGDCIGIRNTDEPIVARWNGTRWSVQLLAATRTALNPDLNGVSCPSPTTCTAVGFKFGKPMTLAERWTRSG